jgi:hypothetical protein
LYAVKKLLVIAALVTGNWGSPSMLEYCIGAAGSAEKVSRMTKLLANSEDMSLVDIFKFGVSLEG